MELKIPVMIKVTGKIGKAIILGATSFYGTLAFAIRIFLIFFDRRTYNSASKMVFAQQIYSASVQILPMFLFVAVIFGLLFNFTAFQAVKNEVLADSLRRLLMGFVVTELSPFVTVLLVALRSSTAISAEMTVMHINRETKTLECFRIDPNRYLFAPRILSGMVSVVLLTSLFSLMVVCTGVLISNPFFGTSVNAYIDTLLQYIDIPDIVITLFKCATFGFFITLIPIRNGLNAPEALTDIPFTVLNGMVKVFMAIVTIEVLSSIIKFI
jgi:phospholipid/cholesterol/gamma-HCH transport system permease protein